MTENNKENNKENNIKEAELAYLNDNEKNLSALIHLGGILFSFIPSLVVWLILGKNNGYIIKQSKEAFNFQINIFLLFIFGNILVLFGIGLIVLPVVWLLNFIACILAALRCHEGVDFRYPFVFRFIN